MEEERSKKKAESETNKTSELEKYWQVVKDNPSDFGGWTYLLHYVEQENNIEAARKAFNTFFKHYPYCYGYWKKFADMEKNLNNFEAAEKIFEEGTKAIPLSVDLWIHYINFYKSQQSDSEDAYEKIKALFKRALAAAGREFRSDRLWDLYVNWEEENKNLKEVTAAYDELLTIPTQLYSHHFEKFRKHVKKNHPREILSTDEFLELWQNVVNTLKHDVVLDEDDDDDKLTDKNSDASPPGMETDDAPPGLEPDGTNIEKNMMTTEEIELMKKKIVEKRKILHEKNEIEVGKRWSFEEAIKRPYFHVKTLERAQLKNWKDYLDYEIENGSHESTVILFERCMIACALYEDMWLKYAKYMEERQPEGASEVYERACKIHLPRKPSIHFSWAAFEEKRGNIDKAAQILDELGESIKDMLEITIRKINLERRRGNTDKVDELYLKCIADAKTAQMSSHFATKYARYLYKVRRDFVKANEILTNALKNDPSNPYILLQLIDVGFQQDPMDQSAILEAFDMALSSDMNNDQKLLFSQRKLEFLEDFSSDPQRIQEAYEEYAKMYKSHFSSRKRSAEDGEDGKEKKSKTEVNGSAVAATTAGTTASVVAADAASYQYPHSAWANYAQNSYNYQQAWTPYAATNYYSSH
ncbi:pre-mRNA-processing factor 39-like isoform X1 [Argiope bruennichi]|uniref:pre-mRNA-processing factor 39-like isoform X1 n=1 Tax=Argiope bruennichi TaxID=94029 RepID=UPI0024950AF1|nr:pre-mRNA-processing factor 39-like isoform X1 [Argiope bruennichi]